MTQVFLSLVGGTLQLCCDLFGEVHHSVRVTPFVVIPDEKFELGSVDHHGGRGIDDAGARIVDVVGGDEGAGFETEDSFERSFRGGFEGGVDFFDRRCGFEFEDAIGEGGVEQGDADGDAIEESFELGIDHGDGGGRSGGGWDEGVDGGAGPAEVLVRGVHDSLGVGEVVEGGDHTVFDAEGLVDHLDNRGDAVGGAGGGGKEVVDGGIVEVVVATDDDIERSFFDGGRDDDFFDALVEVGLKEFGGAELAGAFEDDVTTGPVGGGDGVVLRMSDTMPVDGEGVGIAGDLVIPVAVDGIKFEEMGRGGGRAVSFVDMNEFEFGRSESGTKIEATNTAEAVDSDFGSHGLSRLKTWMEALRPLLGMSGRVKSGLGRQMSLARQSVAL